MTSIVGSVCLSPTMHLEGTSLGLSERLLALLPWGEGGEADAGNVPLSHKQEAGPLMASSSRALQLPSSFFIFILLVRSHVFIYSCHLFSPPPPPPRLCLT